MLFAQSPLPGGLRGNIQEMGSQMPLEYAQIILTAEAGGKTFDAFTNSDGYFQMNGLLVGNYIAQVKLAGFKTMSRAIQVKSGRIGFERFLLEESVVTLDDVVIDVRRQEQQTKVATALVQLSPK